MLFYYAHLLKVATLGKVWFAEGDSGRISAQATTLFPFLSCTDLWTTTNTDKHELQLLFSHCYISQRITGEFYWSLYCWVHSVVPVWSPESWMMLSVKSCLWVRLTGPCLADTSPTTQLRGFNSEQLELWRGNRKKEVLYTFTTKAQFWRCDVRYLTFSHCFIVRTRNSQV